MADNYLEFSEQIDALSKKEEKWVRAHLQKIEDEDPETCALYEGYDIEDCQLDFQSELENKNLWLYAEESANVEHVATFVQQFLKTNRPKEYFTLTWSERCDRPRIGEFSGGAVFVTAEKIEWCPVDEWLEEKAAEFTGDDE